MKSLHGFSLFELLMTLSIIAVLTVMVVPFYAAVTDNLQQRLASSQLLRAIELARQEAIKRGNTVKLSPLNEWWQGYVIETKDRKLYQFPLTTVGSLYWRGRLRSQEIEFERTGFTNGNNGTFLYCSRHSKPVWAIAVNQVSRARIIYPNSAGNIIDGSGKPMRCVNV